MIIDNVSQLCSADISVFTIPSDYKLLPGTNYLFDGSVWYAFDDFGQTWYPADPPIVQRLMNRISFPAPIDFDIEFITSQTHVLPLEQTEFWALDGFSKRFTSDDRESSLQADHLLLPGTTWLRRGSNWFTGPTGGDFDDFSQPNQDVLSHFFSRILAPESNPSAFTIAIHFAQQLPDTPNSAN